MAHWLFKQEPEEYSFADLEAAGRTTWDGVSNPVALKHLRSLAVGDQVFYYHTGKEKAIVGIAEVVTVPRPDPKNEKLVVVGIKPVRKLATPVTLAAIKANPAFAEWELVRIARLSVMPVPPPLWKLVEAMAKGG
ncbi:EVE domain-containing protein [Limnoglobus roseus]|uniref:EVE domain-containing protein n=1 Tax=Limnoglobus roseus TaxID=2598579 RepID=A0A5C1AIX4_9BACT|nr:EVE domain-containing protein [Limnoglobus roseus]QEL17064.1 EVE domain-containing protein [Limnoglobus roseus]